jgi:hypothetical protein
MVARVGSSDPLPLSQKAGLPPAQSTALATAMKFRLGTMTSRPSTSKWSKSICSDCEQELVPSA